MLNNEIENHMDLKEKRVVLFGKGDFYEENHDSF